MGNYLDEMLSGFRKKMESFIFDWEEPQKHDEKAPTAYTERRKQIEKNRKQKTNEAFFDFVTTGEDED